MFRAILLTVVFCATVPAAVRAIEPAPESAGDTSGASLVGAWHGRVKFNSGGFAAIGDLEIMYVFNEGGTMTESSNYDASPPVPPAYGVWRQLGPGRFEAKYLFFWTKAPQAFGDLASGGGWLPAGHGVIRQDITVAEDGKAFQSTISYELLDQAGQPAGDRGEGEIRASRIDF
jgi:hypothetical protein